MRSAESRLLHGEGDLIDQGLLVGGWSRRSGGEKMFGNSYRVGLQVTTRLLR